MRTSSIPLPSTVGGNHSLAVSRETVENMYVELADGKPILHSDAGLSLFTQLSGYVRGAVFLRDKIFAVVDSNFVSISENGTIAVLGVVPGSSDVQIDGDDNELVILSNGVSYRYFGGVLTTITDPEYQPASSLVFLNGTAIWSKKDSPIFFWASTPDDASSISGLDFASAESRSDNLRRIFRWRNDLLLFGTASLEAWQDGGADGYIRREDIQLGIGLAGHGAVTADADVLMWLADDGTVRVLEGATPVRKSTTAIEKIIRSWGDLTLVKAFQWVYQGHLFTCFWHPNGCVRFDLTYERWSVKKSLNTETWNFNSCIRAWGRPIFFGLDNGLFVANDNLRLENGKEVVCRVRTPTLSSEGGFVRIYRTEIDFDTGLSGSDVVFPFNLDWSDNGQSITGSESLTLGVGGDLGVTVELRRCGQTRRRYWEFSTSFPRRFSLLDMRIFAERGLR